MQSEYTLYFEIAKIAISALTPLSIYVAYQAYRANLRKQEDDRIRDADKELLAQAQKSLEWAYNSLTDDGRNVPPKADRLNWLTCARHLLRHETISKQIQSVTYKTVHAEHEEFWRHKFYVALDNNQLVSPGYYSAPPQDSWPENIEVSSAMTIVKEGLINAFAAGLHDQRNQFSAFAGLLRAEVARSGRELQAPQPAK